MIGARSNPASGNAAPTPADEAAGQLRPAQDPPAPSPQAWGESPTHVEVRNSGNVSRMPLEQPRLVIGRAPEAQVHLDNASVSRQHAELFRDPFGRWWIRDLTSRNGTFVNGQRVTERVLAPGDIVQVGACSLVLQTSGNTATAVGSGRSGVFVNEAESSTISTLRELEPPRIAASHLMTLNGLSQRLLAAADPAERRDALCRLMVGEEFHARSAVVLRVSKGETEAPPQVISECHFGGPAAGAFGYAAEPPYVSRSLLRAVRTRGEAALASNLSNPSGAAGGMGGMGAAIEMSIAPSVMTVAAIACPLAEDGESLDVLYASFPPQFGTGEWLALAGLAAKQYQQAEQVWRSRAQAESHAALERELQRARQIQMRLVPKNPVVAGLDLAIGFNPCRWVGGDYVDIAQMKDGRTLLTIADVCGKGLAAALVSATLHTMVHGSIAAGMDLRNLMRSLSTYLGTSLSDESFVTMVAVALDPATGVVECVNAGHPPPLLLVEPGKDPVPLASGSNLPLGLDPTEELEIHSHQMSPGSLMALYTDGLTEQTDEAGEMLGIRGLSDWLRDLWDASDTTAAAAADRLMQRSEVLRGQRVPDDDRTFLVARRV